MKTRLFAGAAAVTASLFLSQASAAEPLVLTPAQMDAVAAGLSVELDSKAEAVGDKAAAAGSARVAVDGKKHGVRIEVTTSDEGKGGKSLTKVERKKLQAAKAAARKKVKLEKAKVRHKLKATKATVQQKLKAVRARIKH